MEHNLKEISNRFSEFKLTTLQDNDICKIYEFRHLKSSNLFQKWLIYDNKLVVTGDSGDAIYESGAMTDLVNISKCDLQYFSSKCITHKQSKFCPDKSMNLIKQMIVDNWKNTVPLNKKSGIDDNIDVIYNYLIDEKDAYLDMLPSYFSDEIEMYSWIRENEVFVGCDWWDGFDPTIKTIEPYWHLGAIKQAIKQL